MYNIIRLDQQSNGGAGAEGDNLNRLSAMEADIAFVIAGLHAEFHVGLQGYWAL